MSIGRYAKEARLVWNAPLLHEADLFISEALDQHFGAEGKWHFYSVDKRSRPLVSRISKVIDRLKKRISKFSFMKAKKACYNTHRAMSLIPIRISSTFLLLIQFI
jgi:hypothetical protein